MTNQISQLARKVCREVAGCGRRYYPPVVVVDGDIRPHMAGEHGYHTTPSGKTIVRHPNAYGWRTVYHCSTLRVEVGRDWLAERGLLDSEAA